jgi:hypothetical protein
MQNRLPYLFAVTLALLLTSVPNANAQFGPYIEKGFGFGAGFSSSENTTQLGASAGYVFVPAFEIGVGVSRSSSDETDVTTTSVGPFVAVYPVRQSNDFPLSVYLGGSYSFVSFAGDAIDQLEDQGVDLSGNVIGVQVGVYRSFDASDTFKIIPYAGVGYSRQNTEASGFGESESNSEETTYFTVSGSLLFETSETTHFALTPSASFGDEDSSFGISASLALPQ